MTAEIAVLEASDFTPPGLAAIANREHALVRDAAESMIEHALRCGQALEGAKVQIPHGEWLQWLSENFAASQQTASNYMRVAANYQHVSNLDMRGLSLRAVLKRLERITREDDAERRRKEPVELAKIAPDVDLRHGDLRTSLDDLAGTVDAIITDPPYPAEFIDEFDALGDLAARLLKPSGLLVAMVGQTHLPRYIERLSRHLDYRWCGAYLTAGPATRIHGRKVGTKWKPLLIFGGDRFITQDVVSSVADDKTHHHWGQSETGMAAIIESFTRKGDLVVDPFLGGGTTAVVCRDLRRQFIGCDVDAAAVSLARERLAT